MKRQLAAILISLVATAAQGSTEEGDTTATRRPLTERIFQFERDALRLIAYGYIPLGANPDSAKIEAGPILETVSYNSVEGMRFQLGARTTAAMSERVSGSVYAAYALRDHRMKYGGRIAWHITPMSRRQPPVSTLSLDYNYDTHFIGQELPPGLSHHSLLQSFSRHSNHWIDYKRHLALTYSTTPRDWVRLSISAVDDRYTPSAYTPYTYKDGQTASHLTFGFMEAAVTFTPGANIYYSHGRSININPYAPTITLTQSWGPAKLTGCTYTTAATCLDVDKLTPLGGAGLLEVTLHAAASWSATPYTALPLTAASLTRRYIPSTLMLLRPMELTADQHVSLFINYSPHGKLLGIIPFLNRLGLRTNVGVSATMGRLSRHNDPMRSDANLPLLPPGIGTFDGAKPYMEASIGIGNILKFLRVDYVWRLTYRHTPQADRQGLRIGIQFPVN